MKETSSPQKFPGDSEADQRSSSFLEGNKQCKKEAASFSHTPTNGIGACILYSGIE